MASNSVDSDYWSVLCLWEEDACKFASIHLPKIQSKTCVLVREVKCCLPLLDLYQSFQNRRVNLMRIRFIGLIKLVLKVLNPSAARDSKTVKFFLG